MTKIGRREFLNRSKKLGLGTAGATAALWTGTRAARAVPPSEKIILGVVGIRGRGASLAMGFALRPDCEVVYLADVDRSTFHSLPPAGYMKAFDPGLYLPRASGIEKAQGRAPAAVGDFRDVLDDKSVDAVVIATPDHWHCLATILACQAGKDVYVEKPVSHSPWEGRKAVEAARKYGRIVQAGTQCRSAPYLIEAKAYIQSGRLGSIHMCRIYNQKYWGNVKPVPDGAPPLTLDWDMWKGPAPDDPYNAVLHRRWHHFWRYSGGDTICDPIHQIDVARWLCGVQYPKSVYAIGGRYVEQGAFETPDTLTAVYEFDKLVMTLEVTLYTPYMLKADAGIRDGDMFPHWPQCATRVELYGTKGLMVVGRHGSGWQVFARPHQRKPVVAAQQYGRYPDPHHQQDFCDAIRTRRLPNADIELSHLSHLIPQFANISYRLGGQKLLVDPKTETFTNSQQGNALLKREYRKPWVVPEQV